VISDENSEKTLLTPDCVRAMNFANMRKQRLVLELRLPALTGKIGRIHSKQVFSELSVFSRKSSEKEAVALKSLSLDEGRGWVRVRRQLSVVSSPFPFNYFPIQLLNCFLCLAFPI
jgi:hypothetical protein